MSAVCTPERCPMLTRLVIDHARATGDTEARVRLRYGLGHPESVNGAPGGTSGAVVADPDEGAA